MGRQGNRHQPRGRRAVLEQGVKILFTLCGRIERSFRWRPAEQHEVDAALVDGRSEEHTSELQSLMRISYAVFCLKKKKTKTIKHSKDITNNTNNNKLRYIRDHR